MAGDRKTKPADKKVLKEARARYKEASEADATNRKDALDDLKFAWNLDNHQWPEESRKLRTGRPCLTENRLPQFIRQVVNAQRENRPAITVAPVKDGDIKVAKVIEGLIRHVEQYSKADLAYDTAFESAVTTGFGYFRITTEYCGEEGFDQDVCIRPIENQFSVHDDPHFSLPDASDRRYCFVDEWVDRDDFETEYGFKPTSLKEADDEDAQDWYEDKRVKVAEYWRVRIERETVAEPTPQMPPESLGPDAGETTAEPRTRVVERKIVEQFLMTGDRIIQESNWSGVYIPIVPVFGSVTNIDGKKYRKSLIRDAKESARIANYMVSAGVEALALQPKAPYVGAVNQFETDEQKWANANNANHAYLQYDVVEGAPPPQRQQPPTFPAAFQEMQMAQIEAQKAIMGLYDASLGARSNETSGVAIEARQNQGNNATYHFIDNMTRAIRYAGLAIIDLLPKVYDQARVARIVDVDGTASMVAINDPNAIQPDMTMGSVDIRQGKYDVVVRAGPSYQTARQENQRALADLVKAYPPLMQAAGDLVIKNMDFPDAEKFAERLMPPGAKDGVPPQLQAQMQQMQQQLQHGAQEFAKLQAENQKLQIDVQKKDVERMSAQVDAKTAQADVKQLQSALHIQEQNGVNDPVKHQQELAHTQDMEAIKADADIKKTEIVESIKAMTQIEVARINGGMGDGENMVKAEADKAGMPSAPDDPKSQITAAQRGPSPLETLRNVPAAIAQSHEHTTHLVGQLHEHIGQLHQAVQGLHKAVSAPKRVVRDPTGRVVGVETVQ